jgi:type VI secretion system protein VasD
MRGERFSERGIVAAIGLLAGLSILLGCAGGSRDPTTVTLLLSGEPTINPAPDGRPSPIVVRVYQLKSNTAFDAADFFQLYDGEAAILKENLLGRDEIVVTPSSKQTLVREFKPEAHYVGVLAAFRNLDGATWRASAKVAPKKKTEVQVHLGTRSVALKSDADQ